MLPGVRANLRIFFLWKRDRVKRSHGRMDNGCAFIAYDGFDMIVVSMISLDS